MMARIGRGGVIAAVLLAGAANLSGQSPSSARQADAGADVTAALLVEVRGLRAAMEQMASAGPRVQLFASRLQLQETRINNMIRRLDTVRDRIGEAQQEISRFQMEEKQLEVALGEQKQSNDPGAREEASMATLLIGGVKGKMATATAALNRHTVEEAQLMAELATEQGRWTAINQQLLPAPSSQLPAGSRKPEAGSRKPEAGSGKLVAGSFQRSTGSARSGTARRRS